MDHDDDGETSYNTFVDYVAFEPTYSQALLTAAGRNVATKYYCYFIIHMKREIYAAFSRAHKIFSKIIERTRRAKTYTA